MANETNFFSKKILIWKETEKGVTPATISKAYSTKVLSYSLAETQKTEKNPLLGNGGQASGTDFGTSDYAGNIDCKYTGGIMPILLNHIIGKATKTDANGGAWGSATVYAVGDIVAHSNTTNDLVCFTAGTSDTSEPDVSSSNDGDKVTDGTVVWVVRPKLYSYTGSSQQCLETVGIEHQIQTGCEVTPVNFKERFTGVFFNSLELKKASGDIVYKYSLPAVAMGKIDSEQDDYTDLTITSEESIVDNAFGFDDLTITVGGSEVSNASNLMLTVNRNTTLVDGIKKGEKIDNTPIMEVSGDMRVKFTIEQYTEAYDNSSKAVVMTFAKTNGDKFVVTLPSVELLRSPLSYSTDEPIYLTIPLNAKGDENTATLSYSCISATNW